MIWLHVFSFFQRPSDVSLSDSFSPEVYFGPIILVVLWQNAEKGKTRQKE